MRRGTFARSTLARSTFARSRARFVAALSVARFVAALSVALAVMASLAPAAAQAAPAFVGVWRARSRVIQGKTSPIPKGATIIVVFKPGGAYRSSLTQKHGHEPHTSVQEGVWKLAGRTLIVTAGKKADRKTDKMSYRVKGRTLTLTQQDRYRSKMILRRVR